MAPIGAILLFYRRLCLKVTQLPHIYQGLAG
jgi:hypothetical protein